MKSKISQFEVWDSNSNNWERIPETVALKNLLEYFVRITPIITDMLRGEEISTPNGTYRIIN